MSIEAKSVFTRARLSRRPSPWNKAAPMLLRISSLLLRNCFVTPLPGPTICTRARGCAAASSKSWNGPRASVRSRRGSANGSTSRSGGTAYSLDVLTSPASTSAAPICPYQYLTTTVAHRAPARLLALPSSFCIISRSVPRYGTPCLSTGTTLASGLAA